MALASVSLWVASSSHCAKSRNGSSAAVKSPTVNPPWCSIEAASDMSWSSRMAGPPARRVFRLSYSGTVPPSLRLAAVLALTLGLGGCAVSGVGSLFAKSDRDIQANADVTGLVGSVQLASTAGAPSETDLVFTRLAIVEVLQ